MKNLFASYRLLLGLVFFAGVTSTAFAEKSDKRNLPYGYLTWESRSLPANLSKQYEFLTCVVGRLEARAKSDLTAEIKKGDIISGGTAYVVSEGKELATANHVVQVWKDNQDKLELFFLRDNQEPIEITELRSQDTKTDFARLALPVPLQKFLITSKASTALGSRVMVVGYPHSSAKQRLTLGYVAILLEGKYILNSPSLPGQSGSPAIALSETGELLGVVGTLTGLKGVHELQDLNGAFSVDYLALGRFNDLMHSLMKFAQSSPDELELKKLESGKWSSDLVLDAYQNRSDLENVALWNAALSRSPGSEKALIEWLSSLQGSYERESSALRGGTKWVDEPNEKKSRELMTKINKNLYEALDRMAKLPYPLINLPVHSAEELVQISQRLKTPQELSLWYASEAAALAEAKESVPIRIQSDLTKLNWHKEAGAMCELLGDQEKVREKRNSEGFVNDYFLYTPALISNAK